VSNAKQSLVDKYATKISSKLNVAPTDIISYRGDASYIDTEKIAAILEERGHYSYLDGVLLADCLDAHYKGVRKLIDKFYERA
jgi:hypothetical protein